VVAIPSGDGAAEELFEDLRAHAKSFQPVFVFVLNHVNSLVKWTYKNLKLSTRNTTALFDVDGAYPLFSVVHNQRLYLADVVGKVVVVAPHCQAIDLLPVGCLVVGEKAYNCSVVSKLNDGVGVVRGHAVVGEQGVHALTPEGPPC
jgi:hypothetical protein